jgi:hypothetical protein
VVERADPPGGDDRHANRVRDGARQRDVEPRLGAVPVHRGQQDLAGAVIGKPARPRDRVDARRPAAAMGEHLPPFGGCGFGVDRRHDALAAEFLGRFAHEFGPSDGGGIDRDFIGPCEEEPADILDRPHSTADGQRHETFLGRAPHHAIERVAVFRAGGDVEKAQLIGPFAIVKPRLRHWVAGIDEVDKIDAFDDPPVLHVETGDDPHLQHGIGSSVRRNAARGSIRPS